MENLIEILGLREPASVFAAQEVVIAIFISFLLSLLISFVYIKTFKGKSYSQSFAQTLIIMEVVITIIIIAVGSNIARAFSLAGALSIVRFRSSIRDPRDVAFIFFAMGSGLACGTGMYLLAVTATIILSGLIYILYLTNYGGRRQYVNLRISVPENLNYTGMFDDVLERYLVKHELLEVRTVSLGTMFELRYRVQFRDDITDKDFLDEIRARNGNLNVSLVLIPDE